jgi:hypothetical protein
MASKKWREYELIVKAIYDALMRQNQLDQLEVQHDVKVQGIGTRHQVDVYCKFQLAGHDQQIIIQVKKEKTPAKQSDLLAFQGRSRRYPRSTQRNLRNARGVSGRGTELRGGKGHCAGATHGGREVSYSNAPLVSHACATTVRYAHVSIYHEDRGPE